MAYASDNLARRLAASEAQVAYQPQPIPTPARRDLNVIPGTRREPDDYLSPAAAMAVKAAKGIGIYFVVLCLVSLTLVGITHFILEQDSILETKIATAKAQSRELEVYVALYEDADRITQYSTQLYGMVPASKVDTLLVLPSAEADAGIESAEAAATQSTSE